jgi:diguanylate cyclase (GGDEF)-like protein
MMLRPLDTYGLVIRAEAPLGALVGQQPSRLLPLVGGGAVVALLLLWQLSSMLQLQRRTKDLQDQLHAEARRDPLTGLPVWPTTNHGSRAVDKVKSPVALMMIGLDGYSRLLIEQGEERGSLLVVQSSRIVAQCLPASARLHRYLCSSFIVLLPEADQTRALAVAEQIRAAFTTETFDIHATRINMTASIGICPLADDEADYTTVINRATTALTTATSRGGNQVCWLAARESWLEQRT